MLNRVKKINSLAQQRQKKLTEDYQNKKDENEKRAKVIRNSIDEKSNQFSERKKKRDKEFNLIRNR